MKKNQCQWLCKLTHQWQHNFDPLNFLKSPVGSLCSELQRDPTGTWLGGRRFR